MTSQEQSSNGLLLSGLDGGNPLAFLAALGTLRGLTIAWPGRRVRLSWDVVGYLASLPACGRWRAG